MPSNRGYFRVYDRNIDSPQILDLNLAERGLLMGLWSLASAHNGSIPYTTRQLRRRLYIEEFDEQSVAEMMEKLVSLDLICPTEEGWTPSRWNQHQYDFASWTPEARTEQKRKERASKNSSKISEKPDVASVSQNVASVSQDRLDKIRIEERRKEESLSIEREEDSAALAAPAKSPVNRKPLPPFQRPTLEEVQKLFQAKSRGDMAEEFWNYYQSNGWRVGRNPMRDLTGAIGGWILREKKFQPVQNGRASPVVDDSAARIDPPPKRSSEPIPRRDAYSAPPPMEQLRASLHSAPKEREP